MKLLPGDTVLASEMGEKGFAYPARKNVDIVSECTGERLNGWLSSQGCVALTIPSDCVDPEDRYDSRPYMVVWIGTEKKLDKNNG